MSIPTVAVLLIAALYAALAVAGLLRAAARPARRAVLAALRLGLLALLAAAYLRPGLSFQRLAGAAGPGVVLLDNSRSMSLFAAESLWNALVQPAAAQARATVLLFGDSLRALGSGAAPGFTDRRSFLPVTEGAHPALAGAQRVLLVSDGNWSNARVPAAFLADREVHYLPLADAGREPWLAVEALDERLETVAGRDARIRVLVSGYAPEPADIAVACLRQEKVVARATRRVGPGFYKDTVTLPLPGGRPGTVLYRVLAQSDTLTAASQALHTVMPAELRAAVRCAVPSLDSRFIGRALRRTGGWRQVATDSGAPAPHLLVVFGWEEGDQAAAGRLAPGGVVLLAACLPCPADTAYPTGQCRLVAGSLRESGLQTLPFSSVPAPEAVLVCPPGTAPGRTLVALENTGTARADTVPLLSAATLRGRSALLLAARGFWRWDFRTQLLEEARGVEHPFSRYVLAQARERIVANLSGNLLAVPQVSSPSEAQDIPLALLLPSGGAWTQPAEVRLTLRGAAGDTAFDTLFALPSVAAPRVEVVIPACAAGLYACSVSLRRQGERTLTYTDTLRVGPDRTELGVAGQNVTLLEQVARPAACAGPAEAAALLVSMPGERSRQTVTATLRMEHTWLLLAALAALFGLEWVLRRVWMLD